jgi:hypothetical protein
MVVYRIRGQSWRRDGEPGWRADGAVAALWQPQRRRLARGHDHILLIVVIGGMGTMYGAVVGAAVHPGPELPEEIGWRTALPRSVPALRRPPHPDRWMLRLLFIPSIYRSLIDRKAAVAGVLRS